MKSTKIIIEGITEEGRVFRPSDWAERLSGRMATFRKQRVIYSPLMRPEMRDGLKCVVIDKDMKLSHPELFEHTLEFARLNHLRIKMGCG